jgi:hypothetical protein
MDDATVKQNRLVEIQKLADMKVFTPVHVNDVPPGTRVFGHTGVDRNENARLTVKDMNCGKEIPDTFCPSPSHACLRRSEAYGISQGYPTLCGDVVAAFPHADEQDTVTLKPPLEWMEQYQFVLGDERDAIEFVWMLDQSLYGRRTAANNWDRHFVQTLKELRPNMLRCAKEPCLHYDLDSKVALLHHVDDITLVGPSQEILLLMCDLQTRLLIKSGTLEETDAVSDFLRTKKTRLQNGLITATSEAHIDRIMECVGLEKKSRSVATPMEGKSERNEGDEEDADLPAEQCTRYRSATGVLIYISMWRHDLQYAVKELARSMSKPTTRSWKKLMRVARYLNGTRDMVQLMECSCVPDFIDVFCDSDWGGKDKSCKCFGFSCWNDRFLQFFYTTGLSKPFEL